ncbi:carbon-nitrogen hydrolase family protein, partial [Candidatus Poribacteria bacterium]
EAISRAIDFAGSEKADILLTPEGSLSGYTPEFDVSAVREGIETIATRAKETHVGLALGTCNIEEDGKCYNQLRFYERDGDYLGFHSKILLCGDHEDPPSGEINDYAAIPLRTFQFKGMTVGGLICNDMWANPMCTSMPDPHLSQQLAKMGTKVIFHAFNGGRGKSEYRDMVNPLHESNLRLRARAGKVWIVTVDNCYPLDTPGSAPSGVIDPTGKRMVEAPLEGEQFFAYSIALIDCSETESN